MKSIILCQRITISNWKSFNTVSPIPAFPMISWSLQGLNRVALFLSFMISPTLWWLATRAVLGNIFQRSCHHRVHIFDAFSVCRIKVLTNYWVTKGPGPRGRLCRLGLGKQTHVLVANWGVDSWGHVDTLREYSHNQAHLRISGNIKGLYCPYQFKVL